MNGNEKAFWRIALALVIALALAAWMSHLYPSTSSFADLGEGEFYLWLGVIGLLAYVVRTYVGIAQGWYTKAKHGNRG